MRILYNEYVSGTTQNNKRPTFVNYQVFLYTLKSKGHICRGYKTKQEMYNEIGV